MFKKNLVLGCFFNEFHLTQAVNSLSGEEQVKQGCVLDVEQKLQTKNSLGSVQLTLVEITTTKTKLIRQKRRDEPDGAELATLGIHYSVGPIQTSSRWQKQCAHV